MLSLFCLQLQLGFPHTRKNKSLGFWTYPDRRLRQTVMKIKHYQRDCFQGRSFFPAGKLAEHRKDRGH